jgi:CRP-like cAMP-binding protein
MADLADSNLKKTLVKKQKCFSKLTDAETDVLSELLVERQYPAGSIIVSEGDTVDSVYFIVSGTADVRHVSIENHKEVFTSLAKLNAGQSIGLSETGFYSLSGLRTATVVAETDMTVFRLSVASFNGFALAYPHVHDVMRLNR